MQNPLEPVPEEDESAEVAAADPQIGELDVESQQQAAAAPAVSMSDLEGTPSGATATPQPLVPSQQPAPTSSPTPQSMLSQTGVNVNAHPFESSVSSLGPVTGSECSVPGLVPGDVPSCGNLDWTRRRGSEDVTRCTRGTQSIY